jgi:hypothetical protein
MGVFRYHARRAEAAQRAKAHANEALANAAEAEAMLVACFDELATEQLVIAQREDKDGDLRVADEARRRAHSLWELARAARARVILEGVSSDGRGGPPDDRRSTDV